MSLRDPQEWLRRRNAGSTATPGNSRAVYALEQNTDDDMECADEDIGTDDSDDRRDTDHKDGSYKSPPTAEESTRFVDQITMEYMMNRQYHRQYLAKTNHTKFQEIQDKIETVDTHQEEIQTMVKELLADFIVNGNFTKYSNALNATFDTFLDAALRFIEDHPPVDNDRDAEVLFAEPKKARPRATHASQAMQARRGAIKHGF
jgi:hypothetical protein